MALANVLSGEWLPRRQKRLAARLLQYHQALPDKIQPSRRSRLFPSIIARLLDPLLGLDQRNCVDDAISPVPALVAAGLAGAAAHIVLGRLLDMTVLVSTLGGAGAAMIAARLWVAARRDAGRRRLEEQFAMALGVMIRCVRAGLSVGDAMRAASGEVPAPTGSEFRRCVDQLQLGVEFDQALAALAARCPLADYRFFGVTVTLQRQTGGNLSETLDNLAETVRRRRALRLKAQSLTSEVRATVAVLALMPLAVGAMMMAVSPDYIMRLFTTESGRHLLGIAIVLQMIGLYLIRIITKRTLG